MKLEDIKQIAVIGSGTMGAGIAQNCLTAGFKVVLQDVNEQQLLAAQTQITKFIRRGAEKGQYSAETAEEIVARLTVTTDIAQASRHTDWVIEAIFENMAAKVNLYKALDEYCHPHTVFASNTSGLSISELGKAANRPSQFVGMHFFNPVPLMPLVEIVRGVETNSEILATSQALGAKLGKQVITCDDSPNFIVNRINRPVYYEAQLLASEGVTPQMIDKAMVLGASFKMGPLETGDWSGLEVGVSVSQHIFTEFGDPKYRPIPLVKKMVRAGHYGRKTGIGWYRYEKGNTTPIPILPDIQTPEMPKPDSIAVIGDSLAVNRLRGKVEQAKYPLAEPNAAELILLPMSDDAETAAEYRARFELIVQSSSNKAVIAVMHPLVSISEFGTLSGNAARVIGLQCPLPFMHDKFFEVSLGLDTAPETAGTIIAFLKGLHYHWTIAPETPAGIALRIIACMINEAAFCLQENMAPVQDMDIGMHLGMSYGAGPFQYADRMGVGQVLAVLEYLQAETGDPRYRPAYLLKKMTRAHKSFY
jgi:3-hydroxybutyryl-CoA dehydrogenase